MTPIGTPCQPYLQLVMKFQKCIFSVFLFYEGFKLFDNMSEARNFGNFLIDFKVDFRATFGRRLVDVGLTFSNLLADLFPSFWLTCLNLLADLVVNFLVNLLTFGSTRGSTLVSFWDDRGKQEAGF